MYAAQLIHADSCNLLDKLLKRGAHMNVKNKVWGYPLLTLIILDQKGDTAFLIASYVGNFCAVSMLGIKQQSTGIHPAVV